MNRLHGFLRDTRGSSTLEFGLMLMVYVIIIFGLLVVSDMGLLAKRVQTEARVLAWNSLCEPEGDAMKESIKARLEVYHSGTLVTANAAFRINDPSSVEVDDNSSAEAQAVLSTVIRRMEGHVAFDYMSPWTLGYPGVEDLQNEWVVERKHLVDTRSNVMFMPPRKVPLVVDPDGDDGGGRGGGGNNDPPPEPDPMPTP